ncbi:thymidylate kinase [Copidosoma floridanum]|uniref:thymidylate kinase n=1 Tax=Copidosoma floridanum TaxID=29053 RepID=UPI0006C97BC7|nr:thymidylate kinase [Copidosoma floridanum]
MPRGAFIVLEGPDRAGKSTQVKKLFQALQQHSKPVETLAFPNRDTTCGQIIDKYLQKKIELPIEAAHLLFSVNRWEFKDKIYEILNKGTNLVVDRYTASGAAYNAATTGRPLEQCQVPDRGLPKPDLVVFLKVTEEAQSARADWGAERFERAETQRKVKQNFLKLEESETCADTWISVDGCCDPEEVHASVLKAVETVLRDLNDKPIGEL